MSFDRLKKWFKHTDAPASEVCDGATLSVTVSSHVGNVREHNEDNYYICELGTRHEQNCSDSKIISMQELQIFAVFDGMGGEAYGEEASSLAAQSLHTYSTSASLADISSIENFVKNYIDFANRKICQMIAEKKCGRSGSTMALIVLNKEMVQVFNVGDSRVYAYAANQLTQITEDQTLAMEKIKANIYTEEEAIMHGDTHKITSYLGVDEQGTGVSFLSYDPFPFEEGKLLICSDGLTDLCSDAEIAKILSESDGNDAERLVEKALENGGKDNVTCIVIQRNI